MSTRFWKTYSVLGCMLVAGFIVTDVQAQDDLNVVQGKWYAYRDSENAMYQHLFDQTMERLSERDEQIATIGNLSDVQSRQRWVKAKMTELLGPFPSNTPLNPTVMRIVQMDGYRIEHVVFESQPGFFVTSSLFVPDGLQEQAPAIVYCSGHAGEAYRAADYQRAIINLAKKGFVVFAFDPIGQGERIQYYDAERKRTRLLGSTHEHSYPGAQLLLTGSSLASYMVWDGIRALDYLCSREEVDVDRIGITGRSGGGTQSAYIAAMDDRIRAAAIESYITSFRRLYQRIGPQDAEQNLPGGIAAGIDHADFLIARLPKPTLVIATTGDYFSVQGTRETVEEVRRLEKFYENPHDQLSLVEDDGGHASTQKNREAMYAFFQEHLQNPGSSQDMDVDIPDADELRVTESGQVSISLMGEGLFDINKKQADQLKVELVQFRKSDVDHLDKMIELAKRHSGYLAVEDHQVAVFSGRIEQENFCIERYFMEGEGDYIIPFLLFKPAVPNGHAVIYAHPSGKSAYADDDGEIDRLVHRGFTVAVPDLLGIGEMGPGDFKGDTYINGVSYNILFAASQLGRSIVGIHAGDLIRISKLIKRDFCDGNIYGFAKGELTAAMTHAAAFDPIFQGVIVVEMCQSYHEIAATQEYSSNYLMSWVPKALTSYDLLDLAASIAPRKFAMLGARDGVGNRSNVYQTPEIVILERAYNGQDAIGSLIVANDVPPDGWGAVLDNWLSVQGM